MGKKRKKKISWEPPPFCRRQLMSLSSLWAMGLLNYLQCSASLFRLAQSQVCFSAELLKPTAPGEPWPLISELLSTVLLLSTTNSCYNKPKFCAVKSFHSGIGKCHVKRGDYLCMFLPRPRAAGQTLTPPAQTPFVA